MAIRFMDSFSHYDIAHIYSKWTTAIDDLGTKSIVVGGGRCLQNALQLVQSQVGACQGPMWHPPFAGLTQGAMGTGLEVFSPNGGNPHMIFSIFNGGLESNRLLSLGIFSNGTLAVMKGTLSVGNPLVILAQSTKAIQDSSWHYYEWAFTNSTSGGVANVYVDGDHASPWISYSGSTGSNGYTDIQLGVVNIGTGTTKTLRFSDFYYGDAMTDIKGDSRVYARLPNRDGSILQWTPKTGLTHYLMVNENPPDDGTTYNTTLGVGNRDTYGFPAIGIPSGTVFAVQVLPMMTKSDVGFRSAAVTMIEGGITYDGPATAIADGSYLYYPLCMDAVSLSGNPWSVTTAVNDEFGVKLTG